MYFKIYQINSARDNSRVKFQNLANTKQYQENGRIDSGIYDRVFIGDADCDDLEDIYRLFNTEGHYLHRGHSLSVSDIVVTENGAYFCDNIGFKKVDFDESAAYVSENMLSVLYVEPHREPFVTEIEHSLEGEQKAVGGLIELVYNDDGKTAIVCNEESKLMGMEGNRHIDDGTSVIAGPFFVVGLTDDDFRSLTEKEMMEYMDRFKEPEDISQEEVEADMGITFISW